jgi:hypothetical protein
MNQVVDRRGRMKRMASYTVNQAAAEHARAGDFRRVHRSGLIACQFRAAEWRHKAVELCAHDLLQHLDNTRS